MHASTRLAKRRDFQAEIGGLQMEHDCHSPTEAARHILLNETGNYFWAIFPYLLYNLSVCCHWTMVLFFSPPPLKETLLSSAFLCSPQSPEEAAGVPQPRRAFPWLLKGSCAAHDRLLRPRSRGDLVCVGLIGTSAARTPLEERATAFSGRTRISLDAYAQQQCFLPPSIRPLVMPHSWSHDHDKETELLSHSFLCGEITYTVTISSHYFEGGD